MAEMLRAVGCSKAETLLLHLETQPLRSGLMGACGRQSRISPVTPDQTAAQRIP